ncbi:patatin [Acidovorax sp. SRB_14]|uniref:patatin-like phospholipase family protein n=1 Tax=unclassified Acidovorax TaxID=2684926 RepID=UPI00145FC76B|nr:MULTISPECIES: patatin-like phospholipase family protein [unclassified Acidovorax]NMM75673.1 patatin [Acidovorax sp. SRB_24]NMM80079.1 patatin [Acidovorax sp. SRB_14]NMM86178.1 patatin [Rhodococcus sp. SRB_17]
MPEPRATQRLNLALQGGGSHGALTWGVLDALLEDGQLDFDGISGTSAGAMNAVALAHGFAQAAQQHKDPAEARAAGAALARATLTRLWEGVGTMGSLMWGAPLAQVFPSLANLTPWLAPAQSNPMNINPLRKLLEQEVDFDLLASAKAGPKLFVCATNVRTGRGEIFSGAHLSVDVVMASACLPLVFKAVEIGGEPYWDGGYSGNPALYPLIYQTDCSDILLVQINPIEHLSVPNTVPEIMERLNEVTFNASLLAELRAIEFVRRLLAEGKLDPGRYKDVRMHRIDGGTELAGFGATSKSRADLAFVRQLFELGRAAGQKWLHAHRKDLGVRATLDLAHHHPF